VGTLTDNESPEWAKKMTDEEWEQFKEKHIAEQEAWNKRFEPTHKPKIPYTNCAKCGKRLILTLCKQEEEKHYCIDCCLEHKWQSDYDWPTECARCGINYTNYLQRLLKQHSIPFSKP